MALCEGRSFLCDDHACYILDSQTVPKIPFDNLTNKLESDEKEKIDTAFKEALERLDDNQNAKKEDYEEKLKEVETVEELRKILVKSSKLSIEDSC
ncbi:hypothetical protein LguiB_017082 [Lonicera macranthoides]